MLSNFFSRLKDYYGGGVGSGDLGTAPGTFEGHYGINGEPLQEGGDTPPTDPSFKQNFLAGLASGMNSGDQQPQQQDDLDSLGPVQRFRMRNFLG